MSGFKKIRGLVYVSCSLYCFILNYFGDEFVDGPMVSYAFWVTEGYSERVLNDKRQDGRESNTLTPRSSTEV